MTCVQYVIEDAEKKSITRQNFEYFLKIHFPGYIRHGVVKLLDNTLAINYDILEAMENNGISEQKNLGKIHLQYKPNETIVSVQRSRDAEGLMAKLMSKNTVHIDWFEKPEQFRHQYD